MCISKTTHCNAKVASVDEVWRCVLKCRCNAHAHAYTHAHTHMHMLMHMHMPMHMLMHTHICTHMHMHLHMHLQLHTHAAALTWWHSVAHASSCMPATMASTPMITASSAGSTCL